MFAVGIPTFNEADNISRLVLNIDSAAEKLGIDIVIINSDNDSPDKTSEIFRSTETHCSKISLLTHEKGKGRNIFRILEEASSLSGLEGLALVDGDVTSFNSDWLKNFYASVAKCNYDFVIPVYSRNWQEGNATNHFFYPQLYAFTNGHAPRQPICGDFALSVNLSEYLLKLQRHEYMYEYGIDILLTLHAMSGMFRVCEIELGRKIHKPSFGKMTKIFLGEASCWYETLKNIGVTGINNGAGIVQNFHEPEKRISDTEINERINLARDVYLEGRSLIQINPPESFRLSASKWVNVMAEHLRIMNDYSGEELAQSVLPWYLMRAGTYLSEAGSADNAKRIILSEVEMMREIYSGGLLRRNS